MTCRGFMNAVNCLHFGVRQYVHIAVTKVVFSSVSQVDRWLTHVDCMELLTSIHSLGVSLSPTLLDCRGLPFFYRVTFLSLHI